MNSEEDTTGKTEVLKDGPCLVSWGLPLSERRIVTNEEGKSLEYREGADLGAQRHSGGGRRWQALRGAGPSGVVPLREVEQQTVLRRGARGVKLKP